MTADVGRAGVGRIQHCGIRKLQLSDQMTEEEPHITRKCQRDCREGEAWKRNSIKVLMKTQAYF